MIELLLAQALVVSEPNTSELNFTIAEYAALLQPTFNCRVIHEAKFEQLAKDHEASQSGGSDGRSDSDQDGMAFMDSMGKLADEAERDCQFKKAEAIVLEKVWELNPDMPSQDTRYLAGKIYGELQMLDQLVRMFNVGNFQSPRPVAPVPPSSPSINEND